MPEWLEHFLVRYPELALFLVIGAGYWIGSLVLDLVPARSDVGRIRTRSEASC